MQTPLHIASRLGNTDIVTLLVQHGAEVDTATKDQYTPLHIAAKEGQDEVAAVLLEQGASPTAQTKRGFTPLHLAAKYGNMKVAKLLIQKDAPVDAQGKVYTTYFRLTNENFDLTEFLIELTEWSNSAARCQPLRPPKCGSASLG